MADLAQILALAETMRDRISEGYYNSDELLDDIREIIRLLNEDD